MSYQDLNEALFDAATNGQEDCARKLAKSGADVNFKARSSTPLMEAIENDHEQCARILIEAGADVNLVIVEGKSSRSALICAVEARSPSCVKLLAEAGADLNTHFTLCGSDCTPLLMCLDCPAPVASCAKCLIVLGVNVNETDAKETETALGLAAEHGLPELVALLIKAGADVNAVNSRGATALIETSPFGTDGEFIEIVTLLLKSGAHVNKRSTRGNNAIMEYCEFTDSFSNNSRFSAEEFVLLYAAGERIDLKDGSENTLRETLTCMKDDESWAKFFFGETWDETSEEGRASLQIVPREKSLKFMCRDFIRNHLLELDQHTNLFMRIPQLVAPAAKADGSSPRVGLPPALAEYLLFNVSLELNQTEEEEEQTEQGE